MVENTHPIERAKSAITDRPLVAVDLALQALGATRGHRSDEETTYYVDVLAEGVLSASGSPSARDADLVGAMLAGGTSDSLAVAALLRLLVLDEDVVTQDERLRPTIGLLDRFLAARLYKNAGVAVKDQAFEKRAKLRNLVAEHEIALQSHIDSFGSLDALAVFRQQLSKLFKDQVSQVVVRPFTPGVTIQTLNEVLTAVQAVVEADDANAVEKVEEARQRCLDLQNKARDIGTAYARDLVAALAERLIDLVVDSLRVRGLADPAELTVTARPKRYPLGVAGAPIVLRLDVKNNGSGQAREAELAIEGEQRVALDDAQRSLGLVAPGERRVDVRGRVVEATTSEVVLVRLTWRDPDGTERESETLVDLDGQPTHVDWAALEYADPYPLEAVTDVDSFVGREAVLRVLTKRVLGGTPGNARIQGQRRVGKTSVANALPARVDSVKPGLYRFITLQSGDYNANTAEATVDRLGRMVANHLKASDPRLSSLSTSGFDAGLSPLTELFAEAVVLAPEVRFVLIIDEFDAMPHPELYDKGPIATALFQTLRSLGSKPNLGIILIGGERMRFVVATHGQALNRFELVPVDYFGDDQYDDYVSLVRAPVADSLTVSDAAVRYLHTATAGNPWLTKSIASEMFDRHRANRDSDVELEDMEDRKSVV